LRHNAFLTVKMQRALLFQKAIWAKMPYAALQRRIPIYSISHQQYRLQSSSSTIHQTSPCLELIAASPLATQLVAHYFASSILRGDAYLLYGEVGAGKSHFRYVNLYTLDDFISIFKSYRLKKPLFFSTFLFPFHSRAFIRACLRDPTAPVPSPTFLLQNIYPTTTELGPNSPAVHHFDLYRLDQPQDLQRLDLETSLPSCVSLIEWAERLDTTNGVVPEEYIALKITVLSESEQQQAAAHQQDGDKKNIHSSSDSEDDEEDDERWRKIEIWPVGERWKTRVEQLQQHVRTRGAALDLHLSHLD
jgi:tRNA A37 threonylcarbamoyladenosine biosynthesis protein TsaE